jgi:Fic family protein
MIEKPITSPNQIQEKTQLSYGTVNTGLQELGKLGIIKEITGKKRNRLYAYSKYIDIIKQGTELP